MARNAIKIISYFDSLSAVNSCQAVTKKIDFRNLLRAYISNYVPNLSTLGLVLDTFPDGRVAGWSGGRSGGEWIIVLAQLGWVLSLAIRGLV